jgi:outer membrane receptor protein involved in Fe transport
VEANVTTSQTSKLQNQQLADETISAAYIQSYVKFGKFSVLAGVRLEWVNRGHYLVSNSTNVMLVRYQASRTTLNVKLRYLFSEKYIAFLDVENILAEPYSKQNYVSLNSNLPRQPGIFLPGGSSVCRATSDRIVASRKGPEQSSGVVLAV